MVKARHPGLFLQGGKGPGQDGGRREGPGYLLEQRALGRGRAVPRGGGHEGVSRRGVDGRTPGRVGGLAWPLLSPSHHPPTPTSLNPLEVDWDLNRLWRKYEKVINSFLKYLKPHS